MSQVVQAGDTVRRDGIPIAKGAGENKRGRPTLKWGLLAGSGAAMVGSGVLYGAAVQARNEYQDTRVVPANRASLEDLYRSNRALSTSSGVCAAAALALGTGAVLVGRW